jgi:DNA-binding XRE family transcriptional regulator
MSFANDPNSTAPAHVARRLEAVRNALGLTKAEFADIIDIDRSSYVRIEKGAKPLLPPTALRIYHLYGVDMNFLYLGQLSGLPGSLSSKVTTALTKRA